MICKRAVTAAICAVAPVFAHAETEYPTLDRVNYALDCMDRHGGQTIDNLVACSCEIDKVAATMRYEDFIDASIYVQNKDMPGDKGSVFRDVKFAKESYDKLQEVRADAAKTCFVRERVVQRKSEEGPGTAGEAADRRSDGADSGSGSAP